MPATPAPSDYHIPATVGTAPAMGLADKLDMWPLGLRSRMTARRASHPSHALIEDIHLTAGPGPAYALGPTVGGGAISFGAKIEPHLLDTPGPNHYTVGDLYSQPKHTMGAKLQPRSFEVRPGPGDHSIRLGAIKPTTPAVAFHAKLRPPANPTADNPSPLDYTLPSTLNTSSKMVSLKSRYAVSATSQVLHSCELTI